MLCDITRDISINAKLNKQTFIITLIIGIKKSGNIFRIDDSVMMITIEFVQERVTINHRVEKCISLMSTTLYAERRLSELWIRTNRAHVIQPVVEWRNVSH